MFFTTSFGDTKHKAGLPLLLIIKKEIGAYLRSLKSPVSLAVLILLMLLSAHLSAIDLKQRIANWKANHEAQDDTPSGGAVVYDLPDGSFFYSLGTGPDAPIQPPQPLSVLSKGMDAEADRTVTIGQRVIFGPQQTDDPFSPDFDSFDTLFIIKFVVSLLALFFTVDAVTREKEQGTLRVILANPIRRIELIMGKAIGASISLLLPFSISYFSVVFYLRNAQGLITSGEEMARVLWIYLLSLLYALIFIFLGLLISTTTRSTKVAIVSSLLAWVMLVVVLPNATVLAAKLVTPAPSYNQLDARLFEAQQQIIQEELSAYPNAKSVFETPNAQAIIARTIEVDRQITDDFLTLKWKQIELARRLASISPAGALAFALSNFAGTGASAYSAYIDSLRASREMFIEASVRRFDLPPQEAAKLIQETVMNLPYKNRQMEPLTASLRASVFSMVSLLIWILILATCAYWRFEKYDAR